jgi:hypothetical protein
VPLGRPDSENVTVYFVSENVIDLESALPSTVNEPVGGDGPQFLFEDAMKYVYDPFARLNVIVVDVDEFERPLLKLTYHMVPAGKFDSTNDTR